MSDRTGSIGLYLAVAPFVGFAVSFAFEAGYASHFNIPMWLIQVDLTHVFVSLWVLLVAASLLRAFLQLFPDRPWWILFGLVIPPAAMLGFAWLAWTFPPGPPFILKVVVRAFAILTAAFVLLWIYNDIVRPVRAYTQHASWWDRWKQKLLERHKQEVKSVGDAVIEAAANRFGAGLYLLIAGTSLVPIVAGGLGRVTAWRQHTFELIASEYPCLALRRYGDSVLCIDVDTTRWATRGTYRLLSFGGQPPVAVRTIRLGQRLVVDTLVSHKASE